MRFLCCFQDGLARQNNHDIVRRNRRVDSLSQQYVVPHRGDVIVPHRWIDIRCSVIAQFYGDSRHVYGRTAK